MPKFLEVTDTESAREYLGVRTFDVKAYGAVGDGVEDDTVAIHAARTAAGVGGKVFFPAGTYLVGPLTANVADQIWELADGAELVYNGADDENMITVSAENVTIRGGVLDISSITFSGTWVTSGIYVVADGAKIEGVKINNSPTHGVYVYEVNNATVVGCTFNEFTRSAVRVHNLETDLHLYDFLIADNYMESSITGSGGVSLYCYDATMSIERAKISRNTIIIPQYTTGTAFEAMTVFCGVDCVIDGNVISGSWSSISTYNLTRSTISNNTVRGFGRIGVEISGTAVSDVAITGNVIDVDGDGVTGTSGIETSGGTVTNCAITGNVIKGFNVQGNAITLSSGSGVTGMVIAGNLIKAAVGSGTFAAINSNQDITNLSVVGNVIDCSSTANSYGLNLASGDHIGLTITGNSFSNIAVRALNMSSAGGGTYADVKFTGNLLRNCAEGLGGSGVAAATNVVQDSAVASANTVALRDGNANLVADAFIPSLTSTATAAGTTTLTVDSTETQLFTGSTTQTCVLPTTSVAGGHRFTVLNSSTGVVTVNASGGTTVATLAAGASGTFTALQATPTTNAHWAHNLKVLSNAQVSTLRDTNGNIGVLLNPTPSAVNYVQLTNNTAGQPAIVDSAGSDTNVNLNLRPKGSGSVSITSSASIPIARFFRVSSAVNYLDFEQSAAGQPFKVYATGSDSNISVNFIPKGSGTLQVNANPVGVKVAVPASAGATGVPGQWAAESGWLYICVAADTWQRVAIATW